MRNDAGKAWSCSDAGRENRNIDKGATVRVARDTRMEIMPKVLQTREVPFAIAVLLEVRNDLVPARKGVQANRTVREMRRQ